MISDVNKCGITQKPLEKEIDNLADFLTLLLKLIH